MYFRFSSEFFFTSMIIGIITSEVLMPKLKVKANNFYNYFMFQTHKLLKIDIIIFVREHTFENKMSHLIL